MDPVVYGAILPHPPILVPQVGGARIKEAEKSKKAMQDVAKKLKSLSDRIDTIVVITPHGEVGQSAVPVYTGHIFEGHLGYFGAPKPLFRFRGDPELGNLVVKEGQRVDVNVAPIAESFLDHGVCVPMYYPTEEGVKKPVLPIAIAFVELNELFSFGKVLRSAAEKLGKKIAVIASADMSHRLSSDSPAGFDPSGKKFDEELVKLVGDYDVQGILNFDKKLAEKAGQDALWSIAVLLGALDGSGVEHRVLSYEGPFGVGYMVADFETR